MKYKNILLHLDNSSGCRNRLQVAFGLAQKFDASLTGMLVVPTYVVPSYIEAQISVDVMTDVTEKALARARETVSGYQQLAEKAGVTLQAEVVEGEIIPILREHSKYADLLILARIIPRTRTTTVMDWPMCCCLTAPAPAWWYRIAARSKCLGVGFCLPGTPAANPHMRYAKPCRY